MSAIRPAVPEDLPELLEIYRPYVEHTAVSFEYTPPTPEAFRLRFLEHTAQFPWLVWEEDGRILGYAYAGAPWERAAYRWCAESSVYLREDCRGRGIGRALYAALEALLQKQGYRVLYAVITSDNAPSLAFHKALGYVPRAYFPDCGYKFGRWYGVSWLEKRLNAPGAPEAFPPAWKEEL